MAAVKRRVVGGALLTLVAFAAGCGGTQESSSTGTSSTPATITAAPRSNLPLVSCDASIGGARYSGTDDGARIVLGTLSIPPEYTPEAAVAGGEGTWKFSAPADFVVRAERPPVELTVPKEWRDRVAFAVGGTKPVSALQISTCPNNGLPWNAFAAVFYLTEKTACVPLTIRVGSQSSTVRFGFGERCPKSS